MDVQGNITLNPWFQERSEPSSWLVEFWDEHILTNVEYITRGEYIPVDGDMDLQRIERFVFYMGSGRDGRGFVLDRINDRIYYDPSSREIYFLEYIPYSAALANEDFERVISAIKEFGVHDWDTHYEGETPEIITTGISWSLGMLFDDGTMIRSSGRNAFPPNFFGLRDFIQILGQEIQERHAAEQGDNP